MIYKHNNFEFSLYCDQPISPELRANIDQYSKLCKYEFVSMNCSKNDFLTCISANEAETALNMIINNTVGIIEVYFWGLPNIERLTLYKEYLERTPEKVADHKHVLPVIFPNFWENRVHGNPDIYTYISTRLIASDDSKSSEVMDIAEFFNLSFHQAHSLAYLSTKVYPCEYAGAIRQINSCLNTYHFYNREPEPETFLGKLEQFFSQFQEV